MPVEADYNDTPEVDFLRFIAGIVDAIEVAGRGDEFKIENVAGQPPGKESQYRNAVVAMACVMMWGAPDASWKNVQELIKGMDPDAIPRKALQHRSEQCAARLEGLRAEARELLQASGDQFWDEALRGGNSGVRPVSVVMKERKRRFGPNPAGPRKRVP